MCLAVPGRVVDIDRESDPLVGQVSLGGVTRGVCFEALPDVDVGDYVLVHVGFALSRVDEAEAQRLFDLLAELGELVSEDPDS